MKLRCKMKGKKVVDKSDSNIEYACRFCNGEIEVEKKGDRVVFKKIPTINYMVSYPREEDVGFNCPATLANPEESNLVK